MGLYTELVIGVPASATPGETVNFTVSVTSKGVDKFVRLFIEVNDTVVPVDPYEFELVGIQTGVGCGSFVMPSIDAVITAYSLYLGPDFQWFEDDIETSIVSLATPTTFHLDVYVPPWAAGGYIDPGSGDYPINETVILTAHPLTGYKFTGWGGDASGTSLTYSLYMNGDKYVEAYFEEVSVAGKIVDKWVNKSPEGFGLPIPADVKADDNTFEIGVRGRNDSDISIVAGMVVTVVDPEGVLRAAPAIDWAGLSPGEELNWEYNISPVDKPGIWTTLIRFQAQE